MQNRPSPLNSCLYRGMVSHRRLRPVRHEFRQRLFLVYLDLSELETMFAGRWLWSTSRLAPARFRREDHLGESDTSLPECVRDLVEVETGQRPRGPVRLLTHLRYWGYVMNPLSLYYCFDRPGPKADVVAVVAEVNNTPWGERHCYVLDVKGQTGREAFRITHAKQFHVSPFLPLEMQYHWLVSVPNESLTVSIATELEGECNFEAALSLERRPLTTTSLAAALVTHPWMTGHVLAAIYWQALRLWWKGIPVYPHPAASRPQHQITQHSISE